MHQGQSAFFLGQAHLRQYKGARLSNQLNWLYRVLGNVPIAY